MIPFGDNIPITRRPIVVYALIALNVLVFIYELTLSQNGLNDFFIRYGLSADNVSFITLLSFNFLHGGFLHIAGNMLFLWIFGDNVEDRLGHVKFLIFYLLAGIIAGLVQVGVSAGSNVPTIGASGAIAAVLGAYLIMFPYAKVRTVLILFIFITIVSIPAVLMIAFWFIQQLLNGAASLHGAAFQSGGIAYFGHIGGFVAGIIFLMIIQFSQYLRRLAFR